MEITKAELAGILEISRPRVTQYCQQGLPVLESGKIDRAAGLNWIARNVVGPAHERAKELLAAPMVPPGFGVLEKIKNPADAALILALLEMSTRVCALATLGAHEAGATREQCEKAGKVTACLFIHSAEAFIKETGIAISGGMLWPGPQFHDEANLDAIAKS